MTKDIGIVWLAMVTCCSAASADLSRLATADGLVLEIIQRDTDLTVLLVDNGSLHPEIEYPFELLYGPAKSGLEISFRPFGNPSNKEKNNLCPVIDMAENQFPIKKRLLNGNVVGQRFSMKQLKELYCLRENKYEIKVRFYYEMADGNYRYVEASDTVNFNK